MQLVNGEWFGYSQLKELRRAIHARRVMNNDVHHIIDASPPVPDDELPYWIWWPTLPAANVLLTLAAKRPAMRRQCVRACIAGGYEEEYVKIMDMRGEDGKMVAVDPVLMHAAGTCPEHQFFEPDMIQRMNEQGISDVNLLTGKRNDNMIEDVIPWRAADPSDWGEPYGGVSVDSCEAVDCDGQLPPHMYENLHAEMGRVRLYLSSPADVRVRKAQEWADLFSDSETTSP